MGTITITVKPRSLLGIIATVVLIMAITLTAPVGHTISTGASANSIASTNEDGAVISVVRQASPAVVSIVATRPVPTGQGHHMSQLQDFCQDDFFRRYFGQDCVIATETPAPDGGTEPQQVAAGTGFIIASNGLILTNKHVVDVEGANFLAITSDNKRYPIKILLEDPDQDIAILKIEANDLPALALADQPNVQIGETVIAIGNALGQFSNTVSKGIISGLSRSIMAAGSSNDVAEQLDKVIQTDAAINLGNSGGPLLNLSGRVIGINTAIIQNAQNIGFAIPISAARDDIRQVTR